MMAAKTNYWKWSVIAAFAIILLLIGRSCGTGGSSFLNCNRARDTVRLNKDTIIYRDTGRIVFGKPEAQKTDTFWRDRWHMRPYKSNVDLSNSNVDSSIFNDDFLLGIDTPAVINDYYSIRYYARDTNVKRGRLLMLDTISENKIIGSTAYYSMTDTMITNTITVQAPKRLIVYFGITGMARINDPTIGGGLDLSIKGRNDMIYGAGVFRMWNQKSLYGQARVALPIRLGKKR